MKNSIRRARLRWKAWRLERKLRKISNPLREFLYLDDVSLYSLLASKSGAIPTDFTDKRTRTWTSELSSTSEVTLPVGKLGGTVKGGHVLGAESQVARKAIVQSTFREFRQGVKDEILFREPRNLLARPRSVDELEKELTTASKQRCAVRVADLRRGNLFELEVKLEADNVFRTSSVIEAMSDLVNELPQGLRPKLSEVSDVVGVSKLMEKLLVGLVPLRCQVIDFVSITVKGERWIVHRDLVASMPAPFVREPIYVVAVTEGQLYWKDLRRVVFSALPVTVLGRIAVPGIGSHWSSMKLGEVMNRVSPDFAGAMKVIENLDLSDSGQATTHRIQGADTPLVTYANACIAVAGREADAEIVAEAVGRVPAEDGDFSSLDYNEQVAQFEHLEAVLQELGFPEVSRLARKDVLRLRDEARSLAEKEGLGTTQPNATNTGRSEAPAGGNIECEVVAIYW